MVDGVPRRVIPYSTPSGGPLGWLRAWKTIREGRAAASRLYESFHPSVVVGFGGYPVLPAMLAARKMGIATVIHEPNSVLGRVNRLLARKVDMLATAYAAEIGRWPCRERGGQSGYISGG